MTTETKTDLGWWIRSYHSPCDTEFLSSSVDARKHLAEQLTICIEVGIEEIYNEDGDEPFDMNPGEWKAAIGDLLDQAADRLLRQHCPDYRPN